MDSVKNYITLILSKLIRDICKFVHRSDQGLHNYMSYMLLLEKKITELNPTLSVGCTLKCDESNFSTLTIWNLVVLQLLQIMMAVTAKYILVKSEKIVLNLHIWGDNIWLHCTM